MGGCSHVLSSWAGGKVTFRDFLSVLVARWRIIALTLLTVIAATAVQTMMTPAVYTASAKIYLSATQPESATGEKVGVYAIGANDLATYVDVLNAPAVIAPLRESLGLQPNAPVSVSADVSTTSNMMTITATSGDPVTAARIANARWPHPRRRGDREVRSPARCQRPGRPVTDRSPRPRCPAPPPRPNAKRNLMLGGLLGLALGIGLALLAHALDTKVRTEDDIKALSPRPILGDIPIVKSPRDGLLTVESDPHGRHAESIRRLRTNMLFVDVTTGGHSFVVTSSVPGEGKTTTTINLAMAMADAGSKVLLIDGDLRNPSVATSMGLDGSFGLTTLLLGHADPADVIQRWRETSLHVLPSGPVPPNPSELLGSEPMETLFGKLAARLRLHPRRQPAGRAGHRCRAHQQADPRPHHGRRRRPHPQARPRERRAVARDRRRPGRRLRPQHGAGHLDGPPLRLLRPEPRRRARSSRRSRAQGPQRERARRAEAHHLTDGAASAVAVAHPPVRSLGWTRPRRAGPARPSVCTKASTSAAMPTTGSSNASATRVIQPSAGPSVASHQITAPAPSSTRIGPAGRWAT